MKGTVLVTVSFFCWDLKKGEINILYYILPREIFDAKNIKSFDKILYTQILALTKKYGYCFATNHYFSKTHSVCKKTISNSISNLKKAGYIEVEFIANNNNCEKRKIYITSKGVENKLYLGREQVSITGKEESYSDNKNRKNKRNNQMIVPFWLEKQIEKQLVTEEEQEE